MPAQNPSLPGAHPARPPLQVSQALWWVPTRNVRGPGEAVTVAKVGRTWATLSNGYRVDVRSWEADGGDYGPPGHCYASIEAYEAEVAQARAWSSFRKDVPLRPPAGVSAADIEAARKLLRM